MKETFICMAICISAVWSGCKVDLYSADSGDDHTEFISAGSEITGLKPGLSAVRFKGDYAFDLFLEQGGAASDQEIVKFLTDNISDEAVELQMSDAFLGGSTISAENAEGGFLFGRNFDWQNCNSLVITAYPDEGYSSVSTANLDFIGDTDGFMSLTDEMLTAAALYAPLDGMNETGLCVAVNVIQDGGRIEQDTGKPDITTTTAIRLLLDKAASADEAVDILEGYDLHGPADKMICFAIADCEGNSVAVEYADNEMIVVETPVTAGFYPAEGENEGISAQQSCTRYEILTETLRRKPVMEGFQLAELLEIDSKNTIGDPQSTQWSVVFDQSALTAVYYHRENYEDGFFFSISNDS
ncbi:MAG: linear amide C-N hydrolase [Eubacteriales bacterium]|nr:linear amide C-N hydrolase [Eubacteriales bacterium]